MTAAPWAFSTQREAEHGVEHVATASTTAITLLAHGSPDGRHALDIERLANRVRAIDPRRPVATSYLEHDAPRPESVAAHLVERGIASTRVVPLLLAPAFHARVDIPASAQAMRAAAPDLEVQVCAPVGPDVRVMHAALELLTRAGYEPDEGTGLLLTATGSRDPRAVSAVDRVVVERGPELAKARGWGAIRAAYLDGGRHISDAATLMRKVDAMERILCVPFLLADGVLRDRMRNCAEMLGLPFISGALADTDAMAGLALARADSPAIVA